MKTTIDLKALCKDIPIEFCKYLEYVRKLQFKSHPDYNYIKKLFKRLLKPHMAANDAPFDWSDSLKERRKSKKKLSDRQNS